MLSGLTDPLIAAGLRAFHSDIQVPWSVAMMAAEACLSRSALSDRFTSVVGEPAMTYVLNWRMAVARDALVAGRKSVAQVAAATATDRSVPSAQLFRESLVCLRTATHKGRLVQLRD
jgi:transcriptional regulator GlxA family with amidase domain